MKFRVEPQEDGRHFSVLAPDGEIIAVTRTREAAEALSEAFLTAWEEAMQDAVALVRRRHGPALVDPR